LLEDDLCPSVVFLHRAVDLDHLILELTDVSNAFQIVRKNHDSERTHHGILAEIKERDTPAGVLNAEDLTGDALVFTYVLASLGNGNTVASG